MSTVVGSWFPATSFMSAGVVKRVAQKTLEHVFWCVIVCLEHEFLALNIVFGGLEQKIAAIFALEHVLLAVERVARFALDPAFPVARFEFQAVRFDAEHAVVDSPGGIGMQSEGKI